MLMIESQRIQKKDMTSEYKQFRGPFRKVMEIIVLVTYGELEWNVQLSGLPNIIYYLLI